MWFQDKPDIITYSPMNLCGNLEIFIFIILIFIIAYFSLDVYFFFVILRFHGSECACTLPNVLEWWSLWWQLFQERRAVATEMEGTAKKREPSSSAAPALNENTFLFFSLQKRRLGSIVF